MKKAKIVLLLFFILCTSNMWGQLHGNGHQGLVSENRVIKDMKIYVSNPTWNGMLIIELDGKPLCTDYDQGILLLTGQNLFERTAEIDVYPGGILSIRAYKNGVGNTNVISMIIPDDEIDPILVVECTTSTHFPLKAYFWGY